LPLALLAVFLVLLPARAEAVPGQSRGLVTLPGNGSCSVAGTYDLTHYITINTNSCSGTTLGIYLPPPLGAGPATPVSTKPVVHSVTGAPVTLSAVDWDASRNLLWGVHGTTPGTAYLINLGNKAVSGPVTATPQFTYNLPGEISLIDGLAWDFTDDTLQISPDVSCNVFHFSTTGTLLGSIQPKNLAGVADCAVSGVAIGAANTLYIGRNGTGEIRRVDKTTGAFIATHATANTRIEDLVCAPNLYTDPIFGPIEVILAKGAFTSDYEAFEVEAGTCPAPGQECPPEDDDDNDGLTNDNESLLLTLLGDPDSDNDGIVDGNDDANGDGRDDEDEDDDDDECPDEDSDGDGRDDEDEDDD
jgi:hypothetical protein